MKKDPIKDKIYLSALLHHIPDENIRGWYDQLVDTTKHFSIEGILKLADHYALTRNGKLIPSFDFVGSAFENLKKEEGVNKYDYKMPIHSFSLSRELFPSEDYHPDPDKILELWGDFSDEMKGLDWLSDEHAKVAAEKTLSLLFKFATTIPNPSNINQEVSWYDYAKIKAGLAVCLYDFLEAEKKISDLKIEDEEEPVLIIRADLSGIQNFIYDIASKQASKNLKGRSFYIQLLSDSILIKMLEMLQLYEGNVMYASGGNFFVIAPNTDFVKAAFSDLKSQVTKAIFDEHGTRFSAVMGYQQVNQGEILNGTINKTITKLFEEKIDRNKKRKFADLIEENYTTFFKPSDVGGEVATDVITGEEILEKQENVYKVPENASLPEKATSKEVEANEVNLIKEVTAKQIFLGRNLKDIKYLIVTNETLALDLKNANDLVVNPAGLGIYFYPVKAKEEKIFEKALTNISSFKVFVINETNTGDFLRIDESNNISTLLYGGNGIPVVSRSNETERGEKRYPGDPKYFHELSGVGRFKRLAVLKMDVDGLGAIFKDVNPKQLTFSYYAALSRHLDWFFKGYLNTLWKNNTDFREYTQIIYSGGDDLFIIGRWDVIIDFSELIHTEFSEFTCAKNLGQDKRLTISGGISIITDKFPIMKAAVFADKAEKDAKRHELVWTEGEKEKWPNSEFLEFKKNSINLFGLSLHWDTEYLLVKKLKEELVKYIVPNGNHKFGLPMSILGRIRSHHYMMRQYESEKNKNEQVNPRWIWNVVYDFSRFKERQRKETQDFIRRIKAQLDEDIKQYIVKKMKFLDKIQQGVFTNSFEDNEGEVRKIDSRYHFLELLNISARWAELEIRSKRK